MNPTTNHCGHRAVFARFLLAGAVNTLFGLGVYAIAVSAGMPVWAALLTANLMGLGFNFLTTGGYAFRSAALSRWPRFAVSYLGLYLLNWGAASMLVHRGFGPIAAQAILTIPVAVASYLVLSIWVFPPNRGDRAA